MNTPTTTATLSLHTVAGDYAIAKLEPSNNNDDVAWATHDGFYTISRTAEELSVVCKTNLVPMGVQHESGWALLQLVGPFEFTLTGILASVLVPLAQANVGIFAISTFNTDCVLVKHAQLATALQALRDAGHRVDG